jgi:hypothetical protein
MVRLSVFADDPHLLYLCKDMTKLQIGSASSGAPRLPAPTAPIRSNKNGTTVWMSKDGG